MITLRPYQARAIAGCRELLRQGARSVCVVAPTGSGKTCVGAEIAARAIARGNTVAWLTHRTELIQQTRGVLLAAGVESVRIVQADQPEILGALAPCAICSVQTLTAQPARCPDATVVITDECHHICATTWAAIHGRYSDAVHIGLTATPQRGDGKGLDFAYERLLVAATYSELIAEGRIVDCAVISPDSRLRAAVAQSPAKAYVEHGLGRPAIVFCATVRESQACAEELGPIAACVEGNMPLHVRNETVRRYRAGELQVLTNCLVLTEGFDAPRCEVCVIARGASHAGSYLQMVGRALRASPGKKEALLIDLSGCFHEHGFPTADREYSLDGKPIGKGTLRTLWQCKACGVYTRLPPSNRTCTVCGNVVEPGKGLKVVHQRLAKVGWRCQCGHEHCSMPLTCVLCGACSPRLQAASKETKAERDAYMAKMITIANEKGYSPGWAWFRYNAKYGR